jgi:acetyl-CoA synthetase
VAEAVAIGVPDPVKGEVATCFVIVADPRAADAQDWATQEAALIAHVAGLLGKPLAPAHVHRVSALPRTRNGKILRRLVRAVWLRADPGDLGSLENPAALDTLSQARDALGPPA